uniref:Protein kinase domain-containing protein n=1 Tax=Timema douglasi TaxID=61478 RepID=A0A7R8VDR5_TIMDO|nr:unnamed protein product [Timema douglasi]
MMKSKWLIFMQYAKNGDVFEYMLKYGALDEDLARFWFRQLSLALQYLHKLGITHRDLKCENALITEKYNVKLSDFSFARYTFDDKGAPALSNTFCGSFPYISPEIIRGRLYDPKCADIWALGVLLFIMLNKSLPYTESNMKKLYEKQMKQDWRFRSKRAPFLRISSTDLALRNSFVADLLNTLMVTQSIAIIKEESMGTSNNSPDPLQILGGNDNTLSSDQVSDNNHYSKDQVNENIQLSKDQASDNIQSSKDQVNENIQLSKDQASDNIQSSKYQVNENIQSSKDQNEFDWQVLYPVGVSVSHLLLVNGLALSPSSYFVVVHGSQFRANRPVSRLYSLRANRAVSRLTLSFHIRSKTDATLEALIGQESAPKPPPPLKDCTCKNRQGCGCIQLVYLCGVALTRALDSCIGNHVTKSRSVRIVADDIYAVFSRSWSPWIRRLPAVRCYRGSVINSRNDSTKTIASQTPQQRRMARSFRIHGYQRHEKTASV